MASTDTSSSRGYNIDPSNPIFFWKPQEEDTGYLGQWYMSNFTAKEADGTEIEYENCEQYMMHRKGLLFDPTSDTTRIILERGISPRDIKALGRQIENFDQAVWNAKRLEIVIQGNYLKFTQDEKLKDLLLATGQRQLVEASPLDRIWGVGYGAKNAQKMRHRWGLNLLGIALMDVRDRIRREDEEKA